MEKNEGIQKEKPLRIISPHLYNTIVSELEIYNIHSYDVLMNGNKGEEGIQITLQFGEDYAHQETKFFSFKEIEEVADDFIQFIKKVAETCKEAMIADYFKMMAP